jgi:hypothetical protein
MRSVSTKSRRKSARLLLILAVFSYIIPPVLSLVVLLFVLLDLACARVNNESIRLQLSVQRTFFTRKTDTLKSFKSATVNMMMINYNELITLTGTKAFHKRDAHTQ